MPRTRDAARFAARQTEILEVAARLFTERGFHQVGIAELCEALDVSPGTLYRYFPSKEALIQGLVAADAREARLLVEALEGARGDFCDRLTTVVCEALEAVSDPDYGRLALEIAAEGARNPAIGEVLRVADETFRADLATIIDAAAAAGDVTPRLPSESVADLLLQWVDGATGRPIAVADASARRVATACLVHGLLRPAEA